MVFHTSGAAGPDALAPLQAVGVACGMLHPLQTIMTPEQGVQSLVGITFGVAGDPPAVEWAAQLTRQLEGQVLEVDADRLSYYHAGAVMASNALVGVVDAALALMAKAGIDRREALARDRAAGANERWTTRLTSGTASGPDRTDRQRGRGDGGGASRGDARHAFARCEVVRGVGRVSFWRWRKDRGLPAASVRAIESVR